MKTTIATRRPVRIVWAAFLATAGYVAGNLLPVPETWVLRAREIRAPRLPEAGEGAGDPGPTREEALRVLARVGENMRQLLARKQALETDAREARIAYQLLQHRGGGEDDPACGRLLEKQRRCEQEVREVEEVVAGVRAVEARLQQVLDGLPRAAADATADAACLREAWTLVLRTEVLGTGEPPRIAPDRRPGSPANGDRSGDGAQR